MSTAPDRVQVWSSQLWRNDFPPICAMTGRPAQTWRRFKFATPPAWSYALLILVCLGGMGIIAFAAVMALTAQRASGYLPLTRDSSRLVTSDRPVPMTTPAAVSALARPTTMPRIPRPVAPSAMRTPISRDRSATQ